MGISDVSDDEIASTLQEEALEGSNVVKYAVKPCLTHQSRNADSESDSDSELFGGTFWVEVNEDQSDDRLSVVLAQPVFGLKKTDISMRGVL